MSPPTQPSIASDLPSTAPVTAAAPSLVFALCVEAGGFESMAIRAVQSLRQFGGRFSSCGVFAVTPRFGAKLHPKTLAAFDSLGVTYLNVRPPNSYAWYPLMNKPLTLLQVQRETNADQICFLDSDMIVIGQPDLLDLDADTDFTACAPDKNIGSSSDPSDRNTPYWREACKVLGLSFDDLPWLHAYRENVDIRIYFNSGLFTFRRSGPFAQSYFDCVSKLLDSKISSSVSEIYFHEQAAVGLVAVKAKLRWKALPHVYNYAMSRKIPDWYDAPKVQKTIILHYHDMMWPANWPVLMSKLKVDRPEIHDWLAQRGPLQLEGSFTQKLTSKLLKQYRKRQYDRHKAACRVV